MRVRPQFDIVFLKQPDLFRHQWVNMRKFSFAQVEIITGKPSRYKENGAFSTLNFGIEV
jgi:hypothetical protein